jgi:hypothetical protein
MGSNTVVEDSYIHDLDMCSAAILLTTEAGPIDNVLISRNVLNGGNYTIYAGRGVRVPNIRVQDNSFGRQYVYGLLSSRGARLLWKNNIWSDTGRRVRV